MPTKPEFKLNPGRGYLFLKGGPDNHRLYAGPINIKNTEYQVRGYFNPKTENYELSLVTFSDWKEQARFKLGKPEGNLRKGKFKLDGQQFTINAIKTTTRSGQQCLLLKVPESTTQQVD